MPETRYVTRPENARSTDDSSPFRVYRLCPCGACSGSGKHEDVRCPTCRGEGRSLQLLATCDTPAALGLAIVTLGSVGEFDDCPMGVMSRPEGEKGTWLVLPWLPSPRNVSDAGKVLASKRWS